MYCATQNMSRSFREKKQHGFTYTVTLKCSAMYSSKNLDVSELLSPVKRPPLTLITDHIMEAATYSSQFRGSLTGGLIV